MDVNDTIVAIATATGGAPRGVVRLSGTRAIAVAQAVAADKIQPPTTLPAAYDGTIQLTRNCPLAARFFIWPGQRSYTREPTVEIHTLGSPPLLDLVVRLACNQGARLANPGEFTLRAFLAGRIDLTQAEAVLGVIDATNDRRLHTALAQLAGGMAGPLQTLREHLLILLADLEAGLDFADEDIEFVAADVLATRLETASGKIAELLNQVNQRGMAGSLPRVVLAGATNAGKSSLFNALVRRYGMGENKPEAIESPEHGATRDYLTSEVCLAGVKCELVDTAGFESHNHGESLRSAAQTMARATREDAALVLQCSEFSTVCVTPKIQQPRELRVATKADIGHMRTEANPGMPIITSAVTGVGLDELATAIAECLSGAGDLLVTSTAERSGSSLRAALSAVNEAQLLASKGGAEELVATELWLALDELGQVAGVVYTDDVLDRVFSRFCIGK